jgi:lipopolysaccharide transport system ATP-binding protein
VPEAASWLFRRRKQATGDDEIAAQEFWAVRDVSFSVHPGQALGIIGPNGAGKSTILKLLTRILKPTHGRCGIRGRVGALIEVAAGFHQDLTGAENIFLQGCIMGMTRSEIETRFDDIVAFSELADFIDTPVKRYSSGMNARLGFAIAAHMSPDVLIVDEVLAVGDFHFQRKAFDRLKEMTERGLPVVIVSHQLEQVASLCDRCLLLDHGRIVKRGRPEECISHYLMNGLHHEPPSNVDLPFRIKSLEVGPGTPVKSGDWFTVRVRGEVPAPIVRGDGLAIRVRSLRNSQVVFVVNLMQREPRLAVPGRFDVQIEMQANMSHGYFSIETAIWSRQQRREVGRTTKGLIHVTDGGFTGTVNLHPRVRIEVEPPLLQAAGT